MSFTLLSPTSNPSGGATVSSSQAFFLDTVIQAKCINPQGSLVTPCRVQLLLSNDSAQTFVPVDSKVFKALPGQTDYQEFTVADYLTNAVSALQRFSGTNAAAVPQGLSVAVPPNWTHFMLRFFGNNGSAVTVSALADSGALSGGGGGSGITALTGDATASGTGSVAISVAKTGGVAFAPSATSDTTNAVNITSGTVAVARLPVMVASGASHAAGVAPDPGSSSGTTKFLREDATWQIPPGGGGSGTVTTASVVSANGFGGSVATATTTPAITLTTSITGLLKGNGTAVSAASAGTDYLVTVPNPSSSTLGGTQSKAAVSHQWLNSISTSGVPSATQPAFTDISGTAAANQLPTTGLTITQYSGATTPVTSSAGTATYNLALSNRFSTTLTENTTAAISNGTSFTQPFNMTFTQAASTGPWTITWFSGITWIGTSAPTMPATASSILRVGFECIGSNTYLGYNLGTSVGGAATPPGGSSGQTQWNNGGAFDGYTMGGDATIVASTGILTVTKTNGVAFASSATVDTTSATNITAGNLPAARMSTNLASALDTAIGSTQGQIAYRNATVWTPLSVGTSGQFLITQGAAANPKYTPSLAYNVTDDALQFSTNSLATPAAGELWQGTSKALSFARDAGFAGRMPISIFSCNSCTAVSNTTTATSIFGSPTNSKGSLTIPANDLQIGNVLTWKLVGQFGCLAAATVRMQVLLNGTVVLDSGATPVTLTNAATAQIVLSDFACWLGITAIGASASATGFATFAFYDLPTVRNSPVPGGSASTLGTTFASNANSLFDIKLTWGAASATNTFNVLFFELSVNN